MAYCGGFGTDLGLFMGFGARLGPIQEGLGPDLAYLGGFGPDLGLSRGFGARFGPVKGDWGQILGLSMGVLGQIWT